MRVSEFAPEDNALILLEEENVDVHTLVESADPENQCINSCIKKYGQIQICISSSQ